MSQVKKHLKVGISLLIAALFALNCARSGGQTQFSKNMEADAEKPALTYEQWVALVGQEKTDALYSGVGQDSINLLQYGIGISNMVNFINNITSPVALVDMIGNDFINAPVGEQGPGGKTGLGAIVILALLKNVDAQSLAPVAVSTNLSATTYCGGATANTAPCSIDVVQKLAAIVNMLYTAGTLKTKMVALFGPAGFNLQRGMSGANDLLFVQRMARVVSHVDGDVPSANCAAAGRICALLTGLTPAEITGKLAPLITFNTAGGIAYANKLVDTIQVISFANITARMVPLIQGVTVTNITAKMAPILVAVSDCTKMGYVVNQVTSIPTLVNMINNVTSAQRIGDLINAIENPASYTSIQTAVSPNNWAGASQTWGSTVKAQPYSVAGSGATLTINMAAGAITSVTVGAGGSGYHSDVSITTAYAAGCSSAAQINLTVTAGVITAATVADNGTSGCSIANGTALTLNDPTNTTGMARLVTMINTVTAAEYYKILNLVDSVTTMEKLVMLVQDGRSTADLVEMLNAMTPSTVGSGACTGVISFTGGTIDTSAATASGFVVPATGLAYINVLTPGDYTVAPTGVSDAGCGALAATITTTGNTPNIQVTMVALNALPVNSMAQLLESIGNSSMNASVPRLREVVDGQRIFNNSGLQAPAATSGRYLNKMVSLITNLDQTLDGPLKVTQMINGITNTDKIIDLIYGVTVTSNLSTIINNIFSASLGLGCSDSASSTYLTSGTCDAGATTAGNGFVWGRRNQAVNTMVYTLENVANIQNLIGLINGATPTQVSDLINHVSSSGDGATTFNGLNSTQVEDPNSGTCGTCSGAAAATSTYSGAGMRLVKMIDYTAAAAYPYDLAFLMNKTSTIKVAKLVIQMRIGQTAAGAMGAYTNGTGKVGQILSLISGTNCFNLDNGVTSVTVTAGGTGYTAAPTISFAGGGGAGAAAVATVASGVITNIYVTNPGTASYGGGAPTVTITPVSGGAGATATANRGSCGTTRGLQQTGPTPISNIGKGKLVNMLNYLTATTDTAAMTQMANLINNVTSAQKLGDLINGVQKSSNMVALINAVLDTTNNNGGATTQLENLLNAMPEAEIHKMIALVQQLNPAVETALYTLPGNDQDLIAQLLAPYGTQTTVNATVTGISFASPGIVTTSAAHTLTVGRQVVLHAAGGATMAGGLNSGQVYYVATVPTGTTFTVATTPGGTTINTSSAAVLGAGTITGISAEPTATSGVGYATMVELLGSLPMTNGTGTGYGAVPAISFGAGCTTAPTATAYVGTGNVTRVSMTSPSDPSCAAGSVPSFSAGSGTLAAVTAPFANRTGGASAGNTTVSHRSLYVVNPGTGYAAAPGVNFSGGCTNITGTAHINGLTKIGLDTYGNNCTTVPTVTIGGAGGATATALVAGPIATFTNLSGGTNYVATQTCPVVGAGGSGATVTITTVGGSGEITAMALATPGSDYLLGQTVTIGGAATAYATVDAAGTITGYTVTNSGCGYTGALTATVLAGSCSGTAPVPGAVTVAGGRVTGIALGTAGTLCVRNPRVIISAGTQRGDGATATVATSSGGSVVAITMSAATNNLAQVLANTEKAPRTAAINYGSNVPNISAREAMVRLMVNGVTYNGGIFPGVGPAHLAYNVMGLLGPGVPVMTVINMLNNDTVSLADLDVLIGCGDQVFYGPDTNTDFEAVCRSSAYW